MLSSVHIMCKEMDRIRGVLVDMAVNRGLQIRKPAMTTDAPCWTMGVFDRSEHWITVRDSGNQAKNIAAAIGSNLAVVTLALMVDAPWSWRFSVYSGHDQLGQYLYEVPEEFVSNLDDRVQRFESERLQNLGVEGLRDIISKKSGKAGRIESSDPRIEMKYRSRISGGKLDLPDPVFAPELPRLIHKSTGLSTAARIRKILSTPHVSIVAAVTEFGLAMDLPNWMDECRLEDRIMDDNSDDCYFLEMIEK